MLKSFALCSILLFISPLSLASDHELPPPPSKCADPVGSVSGVLKIYKMTAFAIENGYRIDGTVVCTSEGEVPVYDVRGGRNVCWEGLQFECNSTIKGRSNKILSRAAVMYTNWNKDREDQKSYHLNISYSAKREKQAPKTDQARVSTEQLDLNHIVIHAGRTPSYEEVENEDGNTVEFFTAELEIRE